MHQPYYLPLPDDGSSVVWIEDDDDPTLYPTVEIRHSCIHHSRGSGLYFYAHAFSKGGYWVTVEDTQVDHNSGAAICEDHSFSEQWAAPAYRNLTLNDNGADALVIADDIELYVDHTLDGPGSFNGKPIHLINDTGIAMRTVDGFNILTITAGTTLLFSPRTPGSEHGGSGGVFGLIIAEGTLTQPITFTSGAPTPQVGDWRGVILYGSSRMAYCDVSYAGKPLPPGTSAGHEAINANDTSVVRRCNIHHNDTGVYSYDYAPFPTIRENNIHHNRIGIYLSGAAPDLRGNNIYQNSDYGLSAWNSYWVPDARYNWWGHPSGPYHPVSNPNGLGDRIEDGWWQGYYVKAALFVPWLDVPAEGSPPQIETLAPAADAVLSQLPQRFQVRAQDPDENQTLYFRVEIYAGYALMRTYDQMMDSSGWDRTSHTPDAGGWVTATLSLPDALPNGTYTWQASVSDGFNTVTTPLRSFRVSLPAWGLSAAHPGEPIATANVTQTIAIYGVGLRADAQVWLEQARTDGVQRLDPVWKEWVSSQQMNLYVNLTGRSGPWDVVVSQSGQTQRLTLYVLPYMAMTSLDYMNEEGIVVNRVTPHYLNLTNHGTAAGVAVIGVIVPTDTLVLPSPTMEYLGQTDPRTHLYAVHLAAGENRMEALYFKIPQSAVNPPDQPPDPSRHNLGDPLRFRVWVIAQPTEEGWQVLRQETSGLQELINGAVWGSALIEGWAIDQYAELADDAAAGEYIAHLGDRYPFIADALVMRQLQEFQLLAYAGLGIEVEPTGTTGLSAKDNALQAQDNGWSDWVRRQIGDPHSFLKGFLLQANEDGVPWSATGYDPGYERGTFLVATFESMAKSLSFGLYKPRIGYWNHMHINGKEQGLVATGHALGDFLSIPMGFAVSPGGAAKGTVWLTRKAAAGLRPGGDRYWRMFKLTVSGNATEPERMGLSIIHKGADYNLIHWGNNPSFGGSHWAVGWTRQPVIIQGVVQKGAQGEILMGAGPHIYTGHAYVPYKYNGIPFGEVRDLELARRMFNLNYHVPVNAWRAGQLEESLLYMANTVDETACGEGSQWLVSSWDPNDIQGWPQRTHIRPPQALEFLIRFENMAQANIPAETVTVTLTVHPNLDWNTMQLLGASHPQTVTVRADADSRTVRWAFPNINLPPNRNPPEGEGWTRLRIEPLGTLTTGQLITAQAVIVFDQNDPIWTNVVTYTIDLHPPQTGIALEGQSGPLPRVYLTATDNPGGSGVQNVALLYSSDDIHWSMGPVLTATTRTESLSGVVTLTLPSGNYHLRAAAVDMAGNTSPMGTESIQVSIVWPHQIFLPLIMRRF